MSGIPLTRSETSPTMYWLDFGIATHIARPVPEDEAREAVIAAARAYRAGFPYVEDAALIDALAALDRLDAPDAT